MRKFIKFTDSTTIYELSPLIYAEFMSLDLWGGASDMAFDQWLRHNTLRELDDFNEDARSDSVIIVDLTHRDYAFNPSGDAVTWVKLESPFTGSLPPGGGLSGSIKRAVNTILQNKYGADTRFV
jgi:hypothetical protein